MDSSTRPVSRRGDTMTSESFTPSPLGALRPGTAYRCVNEKKLYVETQEIIYKFLVECQLVHRHLYVAVQLAD